MKKILSFLIKYDEVAGSLAFVITVLVFFWCMLMGM